MVRSYAFLYLSSFLVSVCHVLSLQCSRNPSWKDEEGVGLHGHQTHCLVIAELLNIVLFFKLNEYRSSRAPFAAGFIERPQTGIGLYREGWNVTMCKTMSGLKKEEQPNWVFSSNSALVDRKLNSHCFFKRTFADTSLQFPYMILYKIVLKDGRWTPQAVGNVIPNKETYGIFKNMNDIDPVCSTCSFVASGFLQRGFGTQRNMTELLRVIQSSRI